MQNKKDVGSAMLRKHNLFIGKKDHKENSNSAVC